MTDSSRLHRFAGRSSSPATSAGWLGGGIAYDRANDLLIMPVNNLAAEVRLIERGRIAGERKAGRLSGDFEFSPQRGTPYGMIRRLLLSPTMRLPCTPP